MSLLTICDGAASSLSLPAITAVVGSSEANSTLLLTLAKREGRELMRRHDWQSIHTSHGWVTTATVAQEDGLPSDFDRFPPDVQMFDSTNSLLIIGPTPRNVWDNLSIYGTTTSHWLLAGNTIAVTPAPEAGLTFLYRYVSKNYCESSGGTGQSDWAADSDVGRIPEHLIELGVVWRWLRAKGMDYAEELATYEREVEKAASRDRGLRAFVISPNYSDDISNTWHGTITEV